MLLISVLYPFGFLHWTFVLFFYFCRLLSRPRWRGVRAPPARWTVKSKIKIGRSPEIFENRLFLGCFLLADSDRATRIARLGSRDSRIARLSDRATLGSRDSDRATRIARLESRDSDRLGLGGFLVYFLVEGWTAEAGCVVDGRVWGGRPGVGWTAGCGVDGRARAGRPGVGWTAGCGLDGRVWGIRNCQAAFNENSLFLFPSRDTGRRSDDKPPGPGVRAPT